MELLLLLLVLAAAERPTTMARVSSSGAPPTSFGNPTTGGNSVLPWVTAGASIGTALEPGAGTAVGAGAGFVVGEVATHWDSVTGWWTQTFGGKP